MPHESTRQYALTPMEAELVACFRLLSDPARNTIISVIASQTMTRRQKLDACVKLSLVNT